MEPKIIVTCDSCDNRLEIPCYWIAKGRRLLDAKIEYFIKDEGWTTKANKHYCSKCSANKK